MLFVLFGGVRRVSRSRSGFWRAARPRAVRRRVFGVRSWAASSVPGCSPRWLLVAGLGGSSALAFSCGSSGCCGVAVVRLAGRVCPAFRLAVVRLLPVPRVGRLGPLAVPARASGFSRSSAASAPVAVVAVRVLLARPCGGLFFYARQSSIRGAFLPPNPLPAVRGWSPATPLYRDRTKSYGGPLRLHNRLMKRPGLGPPPEGPHPAHAVAAPAFS